MKKLLFALTLVLLIPMAALADEEIYTFDCFSFEAAGADVPNTDDISELKTSMVSAIENCDEKLDISKYNLSQAEAYQIFVQVMNENPALFHVEPTISLNVSQEKAINYIFRYRYPKSRLEEMRAELKTETDKIFSLMTEDMMDWEKALIVHDAIISMCDYDTEASSEKVIRNIYDFFTQKKGVCQAYSLAYKYIMDQCGIPCFIVNSDEMHHAWNVVEIGGKYYHVDLTWDDPLYDGSGIFGYCGHNYFLISDSGISADHLAWTPNYGCTEDFENSFWDKATFPLCRNDGVWYISDGEGFGKIENGLYSELFLADDIPVGISYDPDFTSVAAFGDCIFFNSYFTVYAMDVSSGKIAPVLTEDEHISAFTFADGIMTYSLSDSRFDSDKRLKSVNLMDFVFPQPHEFAVSEMNYDGGALHWELSVGEETENARVYAAGFGEDGELVFIKEVSLSDSSLEAPTAHVYKIFVWEDTSPLCVCGKLIDTEN